jgi:hypothetical protein
MKDNFQIVLGLGSVRGYGWFRVAASKAGCDKQLLKP